MIANEDGSERWSIARAYTSNFLQFFRAGYGNVMVLGDNGNVGIGCTTPQSKLAVRGTIQAEEVNVELLNSICPDYVFEPGYDLPTLEEIKAYVDEHKHLPGAPSAKEMEENGMNLKEMNLLLLKKVEELTLLLIKQDEQFQHQINNQQREIAALKIQSDK